MALGKYTRVDGRRSSTNYCSTATLVAFVSLCLVGVWMMTTSSVVPVQKSDVPAQETKDEVKQQVGESNDGITGQFEDSSGDLPDDANKGDGGSFTQDEKNPNPQDNTAFPEKPLENVPDENQEKPEEKPINEEESKPEDGSKTEAENGESKSGDGDEESKTEDANSDSGETKTDGGENSDDGQGNSEENDSEKKPEENSTETKDGDKVDGQIENMDQKENKDSEQNSGERKEDGEAKEQGSNEVFPSGGQSELLNETTTQNGAFLTQAAESKKEKEGQQTVYSWKVCNVTAGPDYIPCLDNLQAIKSLPSTKHYEHRERHCPNEPPTCLVPLPEGYKRPITWPTSRDKVC